MEMSDRKLFMLCQQWCPDGIAVFPFPAGTTCCWQYPVSFREVSGCVPRASIPWVVPCVIEAARIPYQVKIMVIWKLFDLSSY